MITKKRIGIFVFIVLIATSILVIAVNSIEANREIDREKYAAEWDECNESKETECYEYYSINYKEKQDQQMYIDRKDQTFDRFLFVYFCWLIVVVMSSLVIFSDDDGGDW